MDFETGLKQLVATSRRLAETDPQDEAVQRVVDELHKQVQWLGQIEKPTGYKNKGEFGSFGDNSLKDDIDFVGEQVKRLKSAAEPAAKNYQRIVAILAGLNKAVEIAKRPQYAGMRPQIALIVEKVAGVFKNVDTVEDLEKPLESIEKAVHGLYGDQSKNSTYYFDRRNKGHHEQDPDGGASGKVKQDGSK
jgi:hypothetical protein